MAIASSALEIPPAHNRWLKYYRTAGLPTMWCPGCGIGIVVQSMVRAIDKLGLDQDKVVIVTGIGCSGAIYNYLDFDAYHGTHGRALPAATGIKLADPSLHVNEDERHFHHNGEAEVLRLEGEAGAGSGIHHLLAGQRSADDSGDRGDLVLHLDELAPQLREASRHRLRYFAGGADRVAGEKADAGRQCPLRAGLIARHQDNVAVCLSLHETPPTACTTLRWHRVVHPVGAFN